MLRASAVCLGVALVGAACVAPLAREEPIPQAMRVRVTSVPACGPTTGCAGQADREVDEGTLIYVGDDRLVIYTRQLGGQLVIPLATITKLEMYRGRKGSVRAAARDAGIGALAGAALGAVTGAGTAVVADAVLPWADVDVGRAAAEGAVVVGTSGAITGGVHGAIAGEKVWDEVTIHQLRQELCHCQLPLPPAQMP